MIKRLQRKFVLITAVCLLLVEVLIIGTINIININSVNNEYDNLMQILADNDGKFPDYDKQHNIGQDNAPPSDMSMPDENDNIADADKFRQHNFTAETRYQTRYFVVFYNSKGNVKRVDTGNIAAVTSAQAVEFAQQVIDSGEDEGTVESYQYSVINKSNGNTMVIFLDTHSGVSTKNRFLLVSVVIAVVGYIIVCMLVIILSKRAIRPVIESFEKQRQFITDAGHEIKTPLAIISANTEVLELTGESNEWTKSIKNQIVRLNELLKNLLHLAKMEEDSVDVSFSDFNISDAVADVAAPFETLAQTNKETISINITDNLFIHGDEGAIRQLTSILIENAVKYADDNSQINVCLEKSSNNKYVKLSVENVCENPPCGDTEKLFDRFYRSDSSHSRNEGERKGGYGIGLSIAQAVVVAHKGKISCKVDGKNVTFTATLKLKTDGISAEVK